jgi:SAM-dependent methyltransferase
MVVNSDPRDGEHSGESLQPIAPRSSAAIWHDLECGSYTADLPLWRELAQEAGTGANAQPLLDIGAGTGRVALDLAARGHQVTALDLHAELLSTLHGRATAAHTPIETVCADARTFELSRHDFAVCLTPMQTIQLLRGAGRLAFLRRAQAHLRPGGLLACAIVSKLEPFDCATGHLGPKPEITLVDGTRYISRPTRVHVNERRVRIERERSVLSAEQAATSTDAPRERDVVELDRLSASQLRREGREAGLTWQSTRSIPATQDHVGSEVVLLRA